MILFVIKKNMGVKLLALSLLLVGLVSCNSSRNSIAIEEGWELIGESKANFVRDRDVIDVVNANRYTTVRYKVLNKDLRIKDMKVVFPSGDKLTPVINANLVEGQYSKDIALGADGKQIRSIEFSYRSRGSIFKGRATVLVFGKRYVQAYYPVPVPTQQY